MTSNTIGQDATDSLDPESRHARRSAPRRKPFQIFTCHLLKTIVALALASTLVSCSAERESADPQESLVDISDVASGKGGFVIEAEGASVSSAGDVNGDGLDDLVFALPSQGVGDRTEAGKAYVVFGKPDGAAVVPSEIAADNNPGGFVITGIDGGYQLDLAWHSNVEPIASKGPHSIVSGVGDVSGDGLDDVIVGFNPASTDGGVRFDKIGGWWSHTSQVIDASRCYVVFGQKSGTVVELSSIAAERGFRIGLSDEPYREYAIVSAAGDVNGDGLDDLIVDISDSYVRKSYVLFSPMAGPNPTEGGTQRVN